MARSRVTFATIVVFIVSLLWIGLVGVAASITLLSWNGPESLSSLFVLLIPGLPGAALLLGSFAMLRGSYIVTIGRDRGLIDLGWRWFRWRRTFDVRAVRAVTRADEREISAGGHRGIRIDDGRSRLFGELLTEDRVAWLYAAVHQALFLSRSQ